jgi:hypothetical protein
MPESKVSLAAKTASATSSSLAISTLYNNTKKFDINIYVLQFIIKINDSLAHMHSFSSVLGLKTGIAVLPYFST